MRFVALLKTDKINCKLSLINGTNGAKPLVPTLPPNPLKGAKHYTLHIKQLNNSPIKHSTLHTKQSSPKGAKPLRQIKAVKSIFYTTCCFNHAISSFHNDGSGVSKISGIPSKRASDIIMRNSSLPIKPLPNTS